MLKLIFIVNVIIGSIIFIMFVFEFIILYYIYFYLRVLYLFFCDLVFVKVFKGSIIINKIKFYFFKLFCLIFNEFF